MIFLAVFFLSLSSITFEVLLIRVFSISQWNHLSFMVISIALFGFAASGTLLSILDTRKKGWEKRFSSKGSVAFFIILYTVTAITSFTVLNIIPLDYFRLPFEPIQAFYLLSVYILLSLPFFLTGLITSIAYSSLPEKTGFIYFASMAGSAFGAIIPIPLLPLFGEGRLIILTTLIPLVLIPFVRLRILSSQSERNDMQKACSRNKHLAFIASGLVIAFISVILISLKGGAIIQVKPSPYKAFSQILQFPHARVIESVSSIRGRINNIKSPYIRFAPGLSLKFTGMLPNQWAIFKDGDEQFTFYNLSHQKDESFSKSTLPFLGYLLSFNPEHVLLLQHGGGSGIPCALASRARKITIVEQNPQIARAIRIHYSLPVVNQNPRAFLARSNKRFNVIHVENWGTSIPGAATLNQEHLFTIEAFTEYLKHLTEQGILIISRKLLLPPADSLRLWATAYSSLRSLEIKNPESHIALLRNWDTFTLIVSKQSFQKTSIIKDFARNQNFDLVFLQGITKETANRFNIFDEPYHFLEIQRISQAYRSSTEKAFFDDYLLDVAPQSDIRPFPNRFIKWSRLKEIYKSKGSRLYTLFMSGEIVVAVVFFEALIISILLLVLPLFTIPKKEKKIFSHILYFLSVGAGFMFVELFFIKKYILIFGDPVISFTVVISGILIFSSIGGFFSQRLGHKSLRYALIVLFVFLILIFLGFDTIVYRILGFSGIFQYIVPILLLMPLGFLVGFPFPLGMRYLLKSPGQRAHAWTANGCASVLTSILAAQIALSIGINAIIAFAASAYFLAFLVTVHGFRGSKNPFSFCSRHFQGFFKLL